MSCGVFPVVPCLEGCARLVTEWLSAEARGRVTRLSLGGQDVKTARAILKALPNIDSLTIHCKKATEALLKQVAKEQAVNLKEIIVTKVASTVKKDSLIYFFSAAVNAEVLYLPRNLDVDVDVIVGMLIVLFSIRTLTRRGIAFRSASDFLIFATIRLERLGSSNRARHLPASKRKTNA